VSVANGTVILMRMRSCSEAHTRARYYTAWRSFMMKKASPQLSKPQE